MIELGRGVDECCDNGNLISIRIVLQKLSFRHKKLKNVQITPYNHAKNSLFDFLLKKSQFLSTSFVAYMSICN